jgi:nicotinamidase-related amidase
LRVRGIETVFYTGVHANMCILNRTFAIRQMTKWGVRCILLRDLTDAMYNPNDAPHVSHSRGTEMVVEHIEKYWSPTALSGDLRAALQ